MKILNKELWENLEDTGYWQIYDLSTRHDRNQVWIHVRHPLYSLVDIQVVEQVSDEL